MILKRKTTPTITEVPTITISFKIPCTFQMVVLTKTEIFQGPIIYPATSRILTYELIP